MVHNAFDAVQILKDCPVKIESLGLWGARLLVGCIDGSLRIYAPEDAVAVLPSESPAQVPVYTARDSRVGFAKKAVTAMDVLQSRGLLISLSDAVAIHTLPDFDVVSYLTKTKGASLYAWDEERGFLAVAKQKRILLYRYDGSRNFTEVKDLAAPDTVRAMAWCADSLCLSIRREYVIMNCTTGVAVDVFACGRFSAPLIVPLPDGELLLGKDNVGVLVDHNGKLTNQGALSWSEPPATVVIQPPYALARLSKFIEVRSLRAPHGLVQSLPLREMQLLLSTDVGLVAASDTSIYRILPVPIGVQVVQLAASGNYVEALSLCKLLPPEDAALRASKEDAIHIRYGQYLLDREEYEEAMEHFAASSLDLITILSLFPSIKLPDVVAKSSSRALFGARPLGTVTERSLARLSPDQLEVANGSVALQGHSSPLITEDAKSNEGYTSKQAIGALAGFLMSKRGSVIEKAETEDTDAAVAAMVEVVDTKHSSPVTRRTKSFELPTETGGERKGARHGARELATVLDTTLVQTLLITNQSQSTLQLLKGPNYCDVAACEDMMMAGGHYLELLELYKRNNMHRKGLLLLNQLAENPESFSLTPERAKIFGPKAIIEYLMNLGDQDPPLILESSNLLLKTRPEEAIKLFSSLRALPPHLVLSHLKQHAPDLQVSYLEHMLRQHADSASSDFQNELVQLYLARVLDERSELLAQGKWDEREHSEARNKLLFALQNTTAYTPEYVLQRLPVDGLHEERAYLLGRLGQHRLALTLYAHKLHEPELALAYCDRVFLAAMPGLKSTKRVLPAIMVKPSDQVAMNVYLILLEVYLKPKASVRDYDRSLASLAPFRGTPSTPKTGLATKTKGQVARKIVEIEGAEEVRQNLSSADSAVESGRSEGEDATDGSNPTEGLMLDEALGLLSCRWDRFDGAQALRMLPSDTKLQNLLPFLEPLLRTSSEACRNAAVVSSLHRSENLQVHEELIHFRKRVVKVTSERTCSICHKRIGTSVFAVYSNGTIVHFVCYRDRQVNKIGAATAAAF